MTFAYRIACEFFIFFLIFINRYDKRVKRFKTKKRNEYDKENTKREYYVPEFNILVIIKSSRYLKLNSIQCFKSLIFFFILHMILCYLMRIGYGQF